MVPGIVIVLLAGGILAMEVIQRNKNRSRLAPAPSEKPELIKVDRSKKKPVSLQESCQKESTQITAQPSSRSPPGMRGVGKQHGRARGRRRGRGGTRGKRRLQRTATPNVQLRVTKDAYAFA